MFAMRTVLIFIVVVLLTTFGLVGCGGSSSQKHISRADYGSDWPFTVDSGTLGCWGPSAVTFVTEDGTTYALNGVALGWAEKNGWEINKEDEIWDPNKGDIGALIDDGLALCGS
jgi:hypothetical protein